MSASLTERPAIVTDGRGAMVPVLARIIERIPESSNTMTYRLQLADLKVAASYRFRPGQFNMLYVFGVGEAAISISSAPDEPAVLEHTIRHVGSVTSAINRLSVGEVIGLRGPFGNSWPIAQCRGRDVLMVAGGIGIAPLRSAIHQLLRNRNDYRRLILLYGVRSPADMIFKHEVEEWSRRDDFQVLTTVDYPDDEWIGPVGVVTGLLRRIRVDAARTSVLVCGPRVMNRAAAYSFLSHHVPHEHIFVSLERNMRCGIGQCGHCQYGPKFVCKDGPVFSYASIRQLIGRAEV